MFRGARLAEPLASRRCPLPGCGIEFVPKADRQKCCSEDHGRRYWLVKNPYRVHCKLCGADAIVTQPTVQFCSHDCSVLWRLEELRKARLPVLHPNPPLVSWLPRRHPARRARLKPRGNWWTMFVAGSCVWCGDSFVDRAASAQTATRYCSARCRDNAADRRHGRFRIEPPVRQAIYVRDGWTCQLCGDPVDPGLSTSDQWAATLDHIVCQSWGEPDHSPENLRLAHRWCNSVRGDERYYTADVLSVA